ncbi:Histone_H2B [Hexamita inflata]|uniref:Histone H2B n=1 Tax=Hexamita inflata TaxID=28002 RepID=A0AA86PSF0_9EUKA|nr:Histone H2B [Hexamita inflata]
MSTLRPIQKEIRTQAQACLKPYGTYISRFLKAIELKTGKGQKDVGVSRDAQEAMNSLVNDLLRNVILHRSHPSSPQEPPQHHRQEGNRICCQACPQRWRIVQVCSRLRQRRCLQVLF